MYKTASVIIASTYLFTDVTSRVNRCFRIQNCRERSCPATTHVFILRIVAATTGRLFLWIYIVRAGFATGTSFGKRPITWSRTSMCPSDVACCKPYFFKYIYIICNYAVWSFYMSCWNYAHLIVWSGWSSFNFYTNIIEQRFIRIQF